MAFVTLRSPEETDRFGFELGREARPGWVYGLTGPLGAGKTCLVKGLARGLGIRAVVRSPTYGLVCEWTDGRLPLTHLDLYRLGTLDEIVSAGLDVHFTPREGVVVVEWFERWTGPPPPRLCRVILHVSGETERCAEISYDPARL